MARRRSPRSVKRREVPERVLCAGALWQRRLDEALDDRSRDGERVQVETERGLASERVDAEKDGLADAQRVDRGRHAAGGDHADGARVAARDEQGAAELLLAALGQLGQPAEVGLVGDDRPVAGEVHADAGDVDVVHGVDALEERGQRVRHHALAQVAEVHHGDDRVTPTRSGGGVLQGDHRLELALKRDVGELHGLAGQVRRRRAQQPDGRREPGVAKALGVLQA